ncbi:helix-turn-helix domain-containing protein [Pseudomonas nitroreducens]|uniref:helix-turn-helix domain-containing protein n=1 Tax=Pseudomonas nitroreducens TaxID=46680 RepID=UPI002FE38B7E
MKKTTHPDTEQERKMMRALRKGPITTLEAANELDIVYPPNTIRRLRNKGHEIVTHWTYQAIDNGCKPHRVAKYVLLREAP